jgi:hypothetical protein
MGPLVDFEVALRLALLLLAFLVGSFGAVLTAVSANSSIDKASAVPHWPVMGLGLGLFITILALAFFGGVLSAWLA